MSAKPRSKADDAKPEESVRSSYPDGRSPRIPSIPKSSSEPKASKGRASKPAPVIVGPPSRPSSATSASRSASSPKPGIAPAISPGGPKSPRVPAVMARDARVETAGSTADFAEFIKSTGPPGDTVPPPRRAPSTATSSTSTANRRTSTIAATTPKSTSTSRYQARDAAAEGKGGDHGDLIDFIRQGPPGPPGTSHVPKHVAPFRAETPSDASLSISGARDSRASTNVSVQSSANSQAALVNKGTSNGRSYGNGNGASKVTGGGFGDDDMMPQRKQRRVRDPYAIDFSDEEDDDDLLMPSGAAARRPPPKKEESLAEFLRNYQPPPEPEPERAPASERIPKKKASAPSLIGRFRGGFSSKDKEPKDKAPKEKPAKEKPVKEKSSSKTQQQQQPPYSPANPSNSSRNVPESGTRPQRSGSSAVPGAKGHVPIQVSMPPGYDRYGPIEGAAPASGGGGVSAAPAPRMASGSGPRVPMKKFEPRDATPPVGGGMGGRSGTADLAAFLRDSAPPPSGGLAQGSAAREQEESSGFSKMFSRKKGVY